MRLSKVTFLITIAMNLFYVSFAQAEFHFYCGEGREKGATRAEIAFIDSLEVPMKLFFRGREIPDEKIGVKALAGGKWIVSVDRGPGQSSQKFVFSQRDASVQEFSVEERGGGERAVGAKKKCEFRQEEFRESDS